MIIKKLFLHLHYNLRILNLNAMYTRGKLQLYPLIKIVLFLILGIILGDATNTFIRPAVWLSLSTLSLISALASYKKDNTQSALIILTVFCLGGFVISEEENKMNIPLPEGYNGYEAVIINKPTEQGKIIRCDLQITKCNALKKCIKVKANILKDNRCKFLKVGDGIIAYSELEELPSYQTSKFNYKRYLQCHGFTAQTFIYYNNWESRRISIKNMSHLQRVILRLTIIRDRLIEKYKDSGIEGQDLAVLSAMTLGDKSMISKRTKDTYSISGASHVLALSGLHLSIIYAILTLFTLGYKRNIISQIIVISTIWTFVAMVGMSASVVRSAIMLTLFSLISIMGRNSFSLNTLGLTATIMLLVNPLNLFDIGFQMSFLAVAFILIMYKPLYECIPLSFINNHRILKWIWQLMSVSISAQIGTAPLVCYYFGRISMYFLITNIIVIPLSTIILYAGAAMFIVSFIPLLQGYIVFLLICLTKIMNTSLIYITYLPGACIENLNASKTQTTMIYIIIITMYFILGYIKKAYRFRNYQ